MPPEPPPARVPHGLSLQGVDWLPSGVGSGLLRVRGRWAEGDVRTDELPALLAGGTRFASLPDGRPGFGRLAGSWRGAYVLPVTLAGEPLQLEWEDGSRVELPEVALAGSTSRAPAAEDDESPADAPAGELIDRGVLAERRARRAEDAEREQARVAREALAAMRGLELRSAELEARVVELTEGDEHRAVRLEALDRDAAAAAHEHEELRERLAVAEDRAERQAGALRTGLEAAARARSEAAEARSRLRVSETTRHSEAVRSAVSDAERVLLVARLGAAREQAARLARAREAAEHQVRTGAGELAAARADVAALHTQLAGAEQERDRATAAHVRLGEALAEARDALARQRTVVREALTELAATRERAAATERTLRTERLARAALAASLRRERELRARSERDRERSQERVGVLERELAEARRCQQAGDALRARAREQAAAAAAARSPQPRGAGLATDLDAAAAALRSRFPRAEEAPSEAAEAGAEVPSVPDAGSAPAAPLAPDAGSAPDAPLAPDAFGPDAAPGPDVLLEPDAPPTSEVPSAAPEPRWLRQALVAFAQDDPVAAGRLIAGLLPAQAGIVPGELEYDLTIRGVGTYAVSNAAGRTEVRRLGRPRPRSQAELHLRADPRTLAELIAGRPCRIGRLAAPVRLSGRRRGLAALAPVRAAEHSLADAARAGAELEPGLVFRAMAYAVPPQWTGGQRFSVLFELVGEDPEAWLVRARDGAGVTVAQAASGARADATVRVPRVAFPALLRAEAPPAGSRPTVRGDRTAVARLKGWLDRAQGVGLARGAAPAASAAGSR